MGTGRIPASFTLPFNYKVTVKQVPPKSVPLHDPTNPDDDLDGCWIEEERTIYLNKALSPKKMRYLFIHELMHVFADWQHQQFLEQKAKPTGD